MANDVTQLFNHLVGKTAEPFTAAVFDPTMIEMKKIAKDNGLELYTVFDDHGHTARAGANVVNVHLEGPAKGVTTCRVKQFTAG